MALTVLSVAYPLAPVGPDATGGAEQVLTMLDEALVARGHTSIVVACKGSVTRGTLLAIPRATGPLEDEARAAQRWTAAAIEAALDRYPVDVVHLHGVDFMAYLPRPGVPVVATLHLPLSFYPNDVRRLGRARTTLVAVSESQRASAGDGGWITEVVPNGVPVRRFRMRARKMRYALALGRICPEKGFHRAIAAADGAGVPLLIGGQLFRYAAHERYFRAELAPRLGPNCRFLGPLGLARKRRLLAGARCLLVPSVVAETSSLVAMEALACGTPVVAFPSGALPEIVDHGETGIIVSSEDEMARAIDAARGIDPRACRRAAEERFDAERMSIRYLDLYERRR